MSPVVKESVRIRPGVQTEATKPETQKIVPAEGRPPAPEVITFSLTRRLITAVGIGQLLLAFGLVLASVLYVKTHSGIYAVSAGVLFMLAANSFTVSRIRRCLYPLHELGERASEISAPNWTSSRTGVAAEVLPLIKAIVDSGAILSRTKSYMQRQQQFTSDAAHELKTSVAIVKSSLQSLRHRPRTQREYEIGLDGSVDDCARLEELLARMLHLARIEQASENGVRPMPGTANLNSTCEAALARIRPMAEERNIALEWEASDSIFLRADPEEMELIWMNLLENALQYSPSGSTVKMRAAMSEKSTALISVLDSGPGIPPVELPYVFERFHRGEPSPERATGGFGLGLAICKALVDSYGGTIEAVNRSEGGAEICVQLPTE